MLTQERQDWIATTARAVIIATVVVSAIGVLASPVAAQDNVGGETKQDLKDQMNTIGNFLALVIAAVAIPNGAYGIFQYMTAGTDTEQSDKGRKRIRNSFVGVAGAVAVLTAVRVLTSMLGVFS